MIDPTTPGALDRLFSVFAACEAVGIAVSGGTDSLALMLLAHNWASQQQKPPRLVVYTVDHGLRPEAAEEVAFVLAQAGRLGLEARALKWEHGEITSGLQEQARAARYRLIGAAMAADGVPVLATAHHRSDQAETVLMRLAHGSGLEGLRGMDLHSTVEGVAIVRPLLGLDRADLVRVVRGAGLSPLEDPSNADAGYERVRWRQMMPKLSELGLDAKTLARFAERMGEADRALDEIARAAFDSMVDLDGFGSARLSRSDFTTLSPAIAQRVLARVLNVTGGRQKPRALSVVELLHRALCARGKVKTTTVLGCIVRADADAIVIAREPGRQVPEDRALEPGTELVWDGRFLIRNLSRSAGLIAGVSDYLPRHRVQDVLGFKVIAPAEAIRTAPIVRDPEGAVLSLGGWSFDPRVSVELLID